MSTFIFYSANRSGIPLQYSLNRGSQIKTWHAASGVWTDKTIDREVVALYPNNNNVTGEVSKKFVYHKEVPDAHRKNFIAGILEGINAKTLPFIFTLPDGEKIRGTMGAMVEIVDLEHSNIIESKKQKEITKARVIIENLMSDSDLSKFDELCWSLSIPTIKKSANELYLQLIEIAETSPKSIISKETDLRETVFNLVKRARELTLHGEPMVRFDNFNNKFYVYDNPSQPFMTIENIVDTMVNDEIRLESFRRKVAEVYSDNIGELEDNMYKSGWKQKPVKVDTQPKQEENWIDKNEVQRPSESPVYNAEFSQRLTDIFTRVKESPNGKIDEEGIRKEIKELTDYYLATNKFTTEEKAAEIIDEVVEQVFTNYKQRAKWSSNSISSK